MRSGRRPARGLSVRSLDRAGCTRGASAPPELPALARAAVKTARMEAQGLVSAPQPKIAFPPFGPVTSSARQLETGWAFRDGPAAPKTAPRCAPMLTECSQTSSPPALENQARWRTLASHDHPGRERGYAPRQFTAGPLSGGWSNSPSTAQCYRGPAARANVGPASRPDCARAAEKQGPKWLAPGGYSPWSASGSNVSNLTWKTTPLSPVNRCAGLVLRNRAMDQDPGQRVVYPGAGLELTNLGKLAFLKAR